MPGLDPAKANDTIPPVSGAFLPFDARPTPWWKRLLDVVMYPASILVSLTIFAVGCAVLWRRGAKVAAVVWGAALVRRERGRGGREGGDREAGAPRARRTASPTTSRASTTRSRAATRCAPCSSRRSCSTSGGGSAWLAAAWALALPFCLVAASWHVPSDVVGGFLFGCLAALTASTRRSPPSPRAAPRRERARRRRAARVGSRPASSATRCPCSPTSPGSSVELPEDELAPRAAAVAARARRGRRPAPRARGRRPGREVARGRPLRRRSAARSSRRRSTSSCVAARDLPHTREAALFLAADVDLAWRLLALALLAEELGDDDAQSEG